MGESESNDGLIDCGNQKIGGKVREIVGFWDEFSGAGSERVRNRSEEVINSEVNREQGISRTSTTSDVQEMPKDLG